MLGVGIRYTDYVLGLTGARIQDPCAYGLPEILTLAHMAFGWNVKR